MAGEVIVPGAEWKPAPPRPLITDLHWIILHTVVGTVASSLPGANYHLYVRADGSFVQVHDLRRQSVASVQGNPYSIAIVAEDKGPAFPAWTGSNVPAYTDAQVETLIYLLGWICGRFTLPTTTIRTSCLDDKRGIGWHRLGIPGSFPPSWPWWGQHPGCQRWSTTTGKVCPGDRRINQIVNVIVPALEEDEMTPEERALLERAAQASDILAIYLDHVNKPTGYSNKLVAGANDAAATKAQTDTLEASVAALTAKVDQLLARPPGSGTADPAVIAEAVADELHRRTES